ncbi:MAG: hypothetical protein JO021_13545 [Alphaproteobacteria bacterium]|nr:hypothetical protein [Alphaproteobacteria bacterium]
MTCVAEIRRSYDTRAEAWEYLGSRGFSCCADGSWVNGRWTASIERVADGVRLVVWLRVDQAA